MSPYNSYYYNDQGRVYNALSRTDGSNLAKAEDSFREAVRWAPSTPFFSISLATVLEKSGKNEEARKYLETAFRLDPAFTSNVLSQLALDEYRGGQKERAFKYLEEAIQGNTSNAEPLYYRGLLYLSEKKKSRALADLMEVKKLQSSAAQTNPNIQALDDFIKQAQSPNL